MEVREFLDICKEKNTKGIRIYDIFHCKVVFEGRYNNELLKEHLSYTVCNVDSSSDPEFIIINIDMDKEPFLQSVEIEKFVPKSEKNKELTYEEILAHSYFKKRCNGELKYLDIDVIEEYIDDESLGNNLHTLKDDLMVRVEHPKKALKNTLDKEGVQYKIDICNKIINDGSLEVIEYRKKLNGWDLANWCYVNGIFKYKDLSVETLIKHFDYEYYGIDISPKYYIDENSPITYY